MGAAPKIDWSQVDWLQLDVEIARRYCVTPTTVAERRRLLGLPPSQGHRRRPVATVALQLVRCFPNCSAGLIARHSGLTVTILTAARKEAGLPTQSGFTQHPWHLFNWELGNTALSRIWGVSMNVVAAARRRQKLPLCRWNARFEHRLADPAYKVALKAEQSRSTAYQRELKALSSLKRRPFR